MSKKESKFEEGMKAGAAPFEEIIRRSEEQYGKQANRLKSIQEDLKTFRSINDEVLTTLSNQERIELYGFNTQADLTSFDEDEKKYIIGVLYTVVQKDDASTEVEKLYLRHLQHFLDVTLPEPLSLEKVNTFDSVKFQKSLFRSITELLRLRNGSVDYLQSPQYAGIVRQFDLSEKTKDEVNNQIEAIISATGLVGLIEQYGFVNGEIKETGLAHSAHQTPDFRAMNSSDVEKKMIDLKKRNLVDLPTASLSESLHEGMCNFEGLNFDSENSTNILSNGEYTFINCRFAYRTGWPSTFKIKPDVRIRFIDCEFFDETDPGQHIKRVENKVDEPEAMIEAERAKLHFAGCSFNDCAHFIFNKEGDVEIDVCLISKPYHRFLWTTGRSTIRKSAVLCYNGTTPGDQAPFFESGVEASLLKFDETTLRRVDTIPEPNTDSGFSGESAVIGGSHVIFNDVKTIDLPVIFEDANWSIQNGMYELTHSQFTCAGKSNIFEAQHLFSGLKDTTELQLNNCVVDGLDFVISRSMDPDEVQNVHLTSSVFSNATFDMTIIADKLTISDSMLINGRVHLNLIGVGALIENTKFINDRGFRFFGGSSLISIEVGSDTHSRPNIISGCSFDNVLNDDSYYPLIHFSPIDGDSLNSSQKALIIENTKFARCGDFKDLFDNIEISHVFKTDESYNLTEIGNNVEGFPDGWDEPPVETQVSVPLSSESGGVYGLLSNVTQTLATVTDDVEVSPYRAARSNVLTKTVKGHFFGL